MRFKPRSSMVAASASFAFAMSLSGIAAAHAVLSSPPPRDTTSHKNTTLASQCGVARTAKFTTLTAGQSLTVSFNETVGHRGCFQISFAESGDNFKLLGQKDDPADGTGARSMTVTIPNVNCTDCTLQLLQLMNDANGGTPCPANADWTKATSGTYHSCADVHVTGATTSGDAGSASSTDSGTSTSGGEDGGTSVTGDDEDTESGTGTGTGTGTGAGNGAQPGETPDLRAGEGDDGCSMSSSRSTSFSTIGLGAFAALAFVRRARKKARA